jgi:hypothetical protein
MEEVKELGKISHVKFGLGGYQECMLGLQLTFSLGGGGAGIGTTISAWDANRIEWSENCKWTEEDRSKQYDEIMREVSDLLAKAKVDSIDKLKDIPVEVTMENRTFKSFRILTEVL